MSSQSKVNPCHQSACSELPTSPRQITGFTTDCIHTNMYNNPSHWVHDGLLIENVAVDDITPWFWDKVLSSTLLDVLFETLNLSEFVDSHVWSGCSLRHMSTKILATGSCLLKIHHLLSSRDFCFTLDNVRHSHISCAVVRDLHVVLCWTLCYKCK